MSSQSIAYTCTAGDPHACLARVLRRGGSPAVLAGELGQHTFLVEVGQQCRSSRCERPAVCHQSRQRGECSAEGRVSLVLVVRLFRSLFPMVNTMAASRAIVLTILRDWFTLTPSRNGHYGRCGESVGVALRPFTFFQCSALHPLSDLGATKLEAGEREGAGYKDFNFHA